MQMVRLCRKYNVIVLSDEIHCEFINPDLGRPFLPFAPIAQQMGCQWVVANAPNKAFNIAGLQISYIVCPDEEQRRRIDRAINDNEVCDVNVFSFLALQAAYTSEGEEWLRQLVAYIYDGYRQFRSSMKAAFPQLPIAHLEGTYLAWIDTSALSLSSQELADRLLAEQALWLNPGELYGQPGFLRVNLATQHARLAEATRRLITLNQL